MKYLGHGIKNNYFGAKHWNQYIVGVFQTFMENVH